MSAVSFISDNGRAMALAPRCPGCGYARKLESDAEVLKAGLESLRDHAARLAIELTEAATIKEFHNCWEALFKEIEQFITAQHAALQKNMPLDAEVLLMRFAHCRELRDAATAAGRIKAIYLDHADTNPIRP